MTPILDKFGVGKETGPGQAGAIGAQDSLGVGKPDSLWKFVAAMSFMRLS
jgi:hypothetical protein